MKFRAASALPLAAAIALTGIAGPAAAYESGDFVARFGVAQVAPDSSSSSPLGDIAEVDPAASVGFSGTWILNPSLGIEVLAALPFTHDIQGTGALAGVTIGSTRHLPPTISLQWYPSALGKWQPYLGVGVNYTMFFNEKTTSELTTALAASRTDISLDDSYGLALQAGVDYAVGERWLVNAAIWNIAINTKADVSANGASAVIVDVDIDPWVYMIGAGYRF